MRFFLIILFAHLVLLINSTFTLWPEMVVYPYLMNNGFSLYKDIINPYPPFLTSFLAIFANVFGYHPAPYQIFTWLLILIIDCEIFFIVKKLFGKTHLALLSTLFFVILSLPFGINGLWFDLVQVPILLISTYFFYQFFESKKKRDLFFSFFALTIALFIKQQIYILIFWFLALTILKFRKKATKFLMDPILYIPFLVFMAVSSLAFFSKGVLGEFTYWVFYYPFFASNLPGYVLLPSLKEIFPILALIGLTAPSAKGKHRLFFLTACVATIFAYPRFDYFHLIFALTLFSIVAGANMTKLMSLKLSYKSLAALSLVFLTIFTLRFFINNKESKIRFFEKDIIITASFLRQIANEKETIYLQNAPDQILPLSQTLPTKPWADDFPWYLEVDRIQEKVLAGLKREDPRFVIYKTYEAGNSYQIGAYRPESISEYIENNYRNLIQISENLYLKGKINK